MHAYRRARSTSGSANTLARSRLTFYDGTQTAADADLIANAQPAGKWTANSKLTGMSYVYVRFNYQWARRFTIRAFRR